MIPAPEHPLEKERLKALAVLQILDSGAELEFDEITNLAKLICGTSMSVLSFVDEYRQWFKSKQGIKFSGTSRELAFCAHCILSPDIMIVPNTSEDPRFRDHPWVQGEPGITFYAGIPVLDPNSGLPIGALCAIDTETRLLTAEQIAGMRILGQQVQRLLSVRDQLESVKAAEKEIAKLHGRQEFIFEGAGLGAWDWWLESNQVTFDKRWCEMLGIDPGTVCHELKTWDERVHPEDRDQAYNDIQKYLSGQSEVYENIHRLRHEDGSWVWILDRGRISERDSTGRPTRFTGTHFDITSYQKSKLISSEIQKIAKIGGWELTVADRSVEWTEQTYRIYGLSPTVPTAQINRRDFFVEHDRDRVTACIDDCIQGKSFRETFEMIDAHGINKWVESTGVPVRNAKGEVTSVMGTLQDVTEQVRARLAFEQAQQLSKIGNWEFDLRNHNQTWSTEHYRIFEIPEPQPAEILFQMYRDKIHPEDIPELDKVIKDALEHGKDFQYNHRVYLDGGQRIKYVQGIGRVTRDKTGQPILVTGTCQDITDKVNAEKQIELSRLRAAHAGKLASLGELSAGIAHEINNPLAILSGNLDLLPGFINVPEKFTAKLETMKKAVNRIAKIVNGLRKFSRTSDSVNMTSVVLADVIRDAIVMTESKARRNGTSLILDIQTNARVVCDEIEIEQVLINLINNGIDAAKATSNKWVRLRLFAEKSHVILQVEDSGSGITAAVEEKLFQPFFTTKPVGEGTGLGLSICKGILDNHNAQIALNKNFEQTCFEVRFNVGNELRHAPENHILG